MNDIADALAAAWRLVLSGDPTLLGIVGLSLCISLTAVFLASCLGLPLGAALAAFRFPGRDVAVASVNALMGMPPVVAGLFVYLLLSRSGPLGSLGLLFTPGAMIIVQTLLVTIALETSRGDLALALGLGIILLTLILAINGSAQFAGRVARKAAALAGSPDA